MRNPGGYAVTFEPDRPPVERDTITCCHCNSIVFVEPGKSASDAGGFCGLCKQPTCGPCADLGKCVPFEKKLEAIEARDRLRRSAEAA